VRFFSIKDLGFADLYSAKLLDQQTRHMSRSNFSHPITERMFMKLLRTTLITTALLVGVSSMSFAQMGPGTAEPGSQHMAKIHERMAQRHTQHLADLKTQLKLDKDQESAWTTFSQSMQTPSTRPAHPDRATLEKLSTPERLDLMQKHRAQMDAQMQKHVEATKAFYAVLSADQKKIFDDQSAKFMARGHKEHRHPH
jgi:periplasmic protein CpxP/Spy